VSGSGWRWRHPRRRPNSTATDQALKDFAAKGSTTVDPYQALIDYADTRAGRRWLIEVKGEGAHAQARANYFDAVLGQLLKGMTDPDASYSLALPDLPQFRALWDRLPAVAKARTGISALFVRRDGAVIEGR